MLGILSAVDLCFLNLITGLIYAKDDLEFMYK